MPATLPGWLCAGVWTVSTELLQADAEPMHADSMEVTTPIIPDPKTTCISLLCASGGKFSKVIDTVLSNVICRSATVMVTGKTSGDTEEMRGARPSKNWTTAVRFWLMMPFTTMLRKMSALHSPSISEGRSAVAATTLPDLPKAHAVGAESPQFSIWNELHTSNVGCSSSVGGT